MPFIKGQSGNYAGKPKGALSYKTKEHQSRARRLIEAIENHPNFETMLDGLTRKEMAVLYTTLLEYLEPKLARTEITDPNGGQIVIKVQHSLDAPPLLSEPLNQIEEPEYKIIPNNERDTDTMAGME